LLDQIYEVGRRTVIRCTHDYVEDGPKRDRLLWLGDLAAVADVFALTIGDLRPLRRSLLLAASVQLRNGAPTGRGTASERPRPRRLRPPVDPRGAELRLPFGRPRHGPRSSSRPYAAPSSISTERIGPEGLVGPEEETDWWVFLDWNRREPFGSPVEKRGYVIALSLMTRRRVRRRRRRRGMARTRA
jgi:hypothetical protein